jgi:CheY-like chemotaxis protein
MAATTSVTSTRHASGCREPGELLGENGGLRAFFRRDGMHPARILVVEDDDANRQLLIQYLKARSAVTVDAARDGVDALHQVSTHRYDLVILDVMMPLMTGIDFLDSLAVLADTGAGKKLDALPAVIVITAATPEHIATEAITSRFGWIVRAVMRKPLDTCELGRQLDALLAVR